MDTYNYDFAGLCSAVSRLKDRHDHSVLNEIKKELKRIKKNQK